GLEGAKFARARGRIAEVGANLDERGFAGDGRGEKIHLETFRRAHITALATAPLVRLKARAIREVKVLFRSALSGL
ncbi:MAG: hypothetical protein ACRD63_04565, partial [Pyrinomonadaceae bacterium]